MLSNLSDLLFNRVDPDPVQTTVSQTAMVGMSPKSQAQAQQQYYAPQQAQFLNTATQGKPGKTPQAVLDFLKKMDNNEFAEDTETATEAAQGGKSGKKLNFTGVKSTTTDFDGDANNPYKALLKGKYGTKEVNPLTGLYETEEDTYRRFLLGHNVGGEKLDKALYMKERMMEFKNNIPDSVTGKAKENMLRDYLNKIQKEGPVAW